MTSRLELHSVSKSFGKRTVLDRVCLTTDDRLGSVLPLRGPIKLLRYGSGSQVHDLAAIVPAVVWTVALVAMVAVAYHRRWRLHATAAPIDHEMGRRT